MKKNNLIHNKMCTVERWKYFHQFQKYFFILSDETKPWLLYCRGLWLFWWFAILLRPSSTSMNVIRLKNKILHLNLNCGVLKMIVYGSLKYKPLWGRILIKVSHLLLCLSSAVNIVIYYYKVIFYWIEESIFILTFFFRTFSSDLLWWKIVTLVLEVRRAQSNIKKLFLIPRTNSCGHYEFV